MDELTSELSRLEIHSADIPSSETTIIMPNPIEIPTKKASEFIDYILSKKKQRALTWLGDNAMSGLIYLYLFRKYSHNCAFTVELFGSSPPTDYVETIRTMGLYGDHTERESLNNSANEFITCYNTGLELIVAPLSLNLVTNRDLFRVIAGHANLLIFRRSSGTFEVFEPNGQLIENSFGWRDNSIQTLVSIINFKLKSQFRYLPVEQVCPLEGIQYLEYNFGGTRYANEGEGYCGAWSLFFAELTLANPTLTQHQLTEVLFGGETNKSIVSTRLKEIIRGYIYLIYEIFNKYFLFLLPPGKTVKNLLDDNFPNSQTNKKIINMMSRYRPGGPEMDIHELSLISPWFKFFTTVEMGTIKTGLSHHEWVKQNLTRYPFFSQQSRTFPKKFERLLSHMEQGDVFAEVIPGESMRVGGKHILKHILNHKLKPKIKSRKMYKHKKYIKQRSRKYKRSRKHKVNNKFNN